MGAERREEDGCTAQEFSGPIRRSAVDLPSLDPPSSRRRASRRHCVAFAPMKKVLIIEDNRELGAILGAALEMHGFHVRVAENGRAAIGEQRRAPADVVVSDILMPDMDGIETIHELRKEFPGLPIVAMSGGPSSRRMDYLPVARELGAAACLKKPFDLLEFIATVRDLAGGATGDAVSAGR